MCGGRVGLETALRIDLPNLQFNIFILDWYDLCFVINTCKENEQHIVSYNLSIGWPYEHKEGDRETCNSHLPTVDIKEDWNLPSQKRVSIAVLPTFVSPMISTLKIRSKFFSESTSTSDSVCAILSRSTRTSFVLVQFRAEDLGTRLCSAAHVYNHVDLRR